MSVQQNLQPAEGFEVWQMQIPGTIRLGVLRPNHLGQMVKERLVIGPNRVGYQFQISTSDRDMNQRDCVDPKHDPFRNGMFVRVDADQQAEANTQSADALDDGDLVDLCDLPQDQFEGKVASLGEVTVRRLLDIATRMDVSHRKVSFLQEHVRERFAVGGPQRSVVAESPA